MQPNVLPGPLCGIIQELNRDRGQLGYCGNKNVLSEFSAGPVPS